MQTFVRRLGKDMTLLTHRVIDAQAFPRLVDIVVITVIWAGGALLVNPIGNFPLNDDWAYGLTVKHLLETGQFRPMGAPTAQILSNVLWGALFCIPKGVSFTALRISTLLASLLGLFGCYLFARNLKASRYASLVVTLTLALNPIYCELSYTFMTDVFFLALLIWSANCFHKALITNNRCPIVMGTLLAIAAMLSREIGLCVPLAFAISCLLDTGRKFTARLTSLTPTVVCSACLIAYKLWLIAIASSAKDLNSAAMLELLTRPSDMAVNIMDHIFVIVIYLGLFSLPVLLLSVKPLVPTGKRESLLVVIVAAVFVGGAITHVCASPPKLFAPPGISILLMPFGYNILTPAGLGPDILRDTTVIGINQRIYFPTSFWITATVMGVAGAYLLILGIVREFSNRAAPYRWATPGDLGGVTMRFTLLCGALYLVPIVLSPVSYDQYLPPAVFFFAAYLGAKAPNSSEYRYFLRYRMFIPLLLSAFAIFSIACTHDYLMLNRVRWNALRDLQNERGISAKEIDGGFEFNGWYLYSDTYQRKPGYSWWWVYQDNYLVALGDVPGYTRVRTYGYRNWLPRHDQQILILSRNGHARPLATRQE